MGTFFEIVGAAAVVAFVAPIVLILAAALLLNKLTKWN